jgi:hypothetical protein
LRTGSVSNRNAEFISQSGKEDTESQFGSSFLSYGVDTSQNSSQTCVVNVGRFEKLLKFEVIEPKVKGLHDVGEFFASKSIISPLVGGSEFVQ